MQSQLEQIIDEMRGLEDLFNKEGEALKTESLLPETDPAKAVILGRRAAQSFGVAQGLNIAVVILRQKRFEMEENR